ncbi:MAG: shikimate dehydrogenase [Bacteroidota bacterium]|nr:shikimate dehydrogenase [Bacteroidota bacterium]
MRKFGLIGYPLGHSFSRQYFTEKFQLENISDCLYNNYQLASITELPGLLYSDPLLEGLNVTIPFKTEVLKYLDKIDPEANQVGAVNVLKIGRKRTEAVISGFNSDIFGIHETLKPVLSRKIQNAIVLGTGGSSRAVCYLLNKINVRYTLISRSLKPGCLTYAGLSSELLGKTQLIVNTTPLGMFPDIDGKPDIRYDLLNEKHVLFDLVYNPEMTAFLKEGKVRGCTVLTGLKMLYAQAERSWEIWNDRNL